MEFLGDRTSGRRHFATRPEAVSWMRLRRHLNDMPGAVFVDLACDRMSEAALVFTYRDHRFGVDLHDGAYRFTVENPACPGEVLGEVVTYAEQLLRPGPRLPAPG
jgi:hypothetical protein